MRVLRVNQKKKLSKLYFGIVGVIGVSVIIGGIVLGNPILVGVGAGILAMGCGIGVAVNRERDYLA